MNVFAFTMHGTGETSTGPIVLLFARVPRAIELGHLLAARLSEIPANLSPSDYARVLASFGLDDRKLQELFLQVQLDAVHGAPWPSRELEHEGACFSIQVVEVHGLPAELDAPPRETEGEPGRG